MSRTGEIVERVVGAMAADVSVAMDALLSAGWPLSRLYQTLIRDEDWDRSAQFRTLIYIRRGVEFSDDAPVFEAVQRVTIALDGPRVEVGTAAHWLVSPIPTPHPRTIRAANPPPGPTHCPHCGNEIDVDTCWCGEDGDHEAWEHGHAPVPMGCTCLMEQ